MCYENTKNKASPLIFVKECKLPWALDIRFYPITLNDLLLPEKHDVDISGC